MNSSDVNAIEALGRIYDSTELRDPIDIIWWRQRQLIEGYRHIERRNKLVMPDAIPVDFHSSAHQRFLKDLSWRVVEELAEAELARHELLTADGSYDDLIHEHIREELADALHFLVELMIFSGFDSTTVKKWDSTINWENGTPVTPRSSWEVHFTDFVAKLGWTMVALKNKSWKSTQMMTDSAEYKIRLRAAWSAFVEFCLSAKFDAFQMLELYIKKSEVNLFRQRSNY